MRSLISRWLPCEITSVRVRHFPSASDPSQNLIHCALRMNKVKAILSIFCYPIYNIIPVLDCNSIILTWGGPGARRGRVSPVTVSWGPTRRPAVIGPKPAGSTRSVPRPSLMVPRAIVTIITVIRAATTRRVMRQQHNEITKLLSRKSAAWECSTAHVWFPS